MTRSCGRRAGARRGHSPGARGCGDYATNIALQLARPAGRPPREVAEILQALLLSSGITDGATDGITGSITDVVITGPGFLNISLGATASATVVEEILRRGMRYGYVNGPSADFIPLYCPHEVRAVVVMDALARILQSQGAAVRTGCEAPPIRAGSTSSGYGSTGVVRRTRPRCPTTPCVRCPPPSTPSRSAVTPHAGPLLHPAGHDRPRLTDEHLVQRESNPLFRVRYAHARTRALSRNAADLGFDAEPGDVRHDVAVLLADHPRVLAQAAAHRAPDRLARHLVTVADAVLPLLPAVLPRGAEKPSATHRARLALAEAAGTVLAGGLSLLGIDAPDHL
ncbi:ArgS-related anticodon-binding protein NrtL [Streptomyces sp. Marseille-Q5077]|uniref:ArgS-related anticodon-binding protein NrtL n=1 Tax=Streptomyces sp. Marseille-Q5077 TaxID=3418995 RepID=UPI003CFD8440